MTNRLAWFTTYSAKKALFYVSMAGSATAFGASYLPHTFFLDRYKNIVSLYERAQPVPVPNSVMKTWEKTLSDLKLPQSTLHFLKPFMVFGFDVWHAGFVRSMNGAIIGIPINFTYKDAKAMNPTPILVDNKSVDWSHPEAKKLLESLILSENAQCYAIGREILMTTNYLPLVNSIVAAFLIQSYYALTSTINTRFKMFEHPRSLRFMVYLSAGFVTFVTWYMQCDFLYTSTEEEADEKLSELGDNYVKGAIEFYTKMLERNKALRTLMGKKGEEVWDSEGNEIHMLRRPTIPIDKRKKYFEEKLYGTKPESLPAGQAELLAQ